MTDDHSINDLIAAQRADQHERALGDLLGQDQHERALGDLLGLDHGIPLEATFLVSPDIGARLKAEGHVLPPNVRISWLVPEATIYLIREPRL